MVPKLWASKSPLALWKWVKKADFVAVDMRKVNLMPYYSPVSAVVYSASGGDVSMVVVDAKVVVEKGKLMTMDEEEV
jgi:cytosine/adenosine deaminase-related metal-dependent hydrolase